jgi:hypothetical protein
LEPAEISPQMLVPGSLALAYPVDSHTH